jgi:hypothetical protein
MKRILRGAVLLAVTAVLGACGTEPDQVKGGAADHIVADPGVVFISREDSQAVKIRLEDVQGTALHDPITISNIGAGINVRPDSAFRPIFTDGDSLVFNTNGTELRVWVSTSALANSSFTINAGGLTLNVPVVVTPNKNESFPFSNLAPVLGEVVTATVTSDLLFTDSTKVVFGSQTLTPVSVAPDGKTLTFNAGPDLLGPATFTNVTLSYNKNVVFPVTAADTLNSPAGVQNFTFSDVSTDFGQVVTVTAPAGIVFTPATKVTFDSTAVKFDSVPVPVFTIAPGGASLTVTAAPGTVGPTTFTNVANPANPTFTFTLRSADTLKSVPAVQPFGFSSLTPSVGQTITVTPPAGAIFTSATKVTFKSAGPTPRFTIAPGGTSMSLTAGPNSVGPTIFTKLIAAANPAAPFSLLSQDTVISEKVDTFRVTVDKTAAAANENVTFTGATSNYRFSAKSTRLAVGGIPSLLLSIPADSSSAVVLPAPGVAAGKTAVSSPVVAGFVLGNLPTNAPAITVGALTPQAGTDDFTTAPTINAPAVGATVAFWDGGPYTKTSKFGDGELVYKLVVAAGGKYQFELPFISDASDLGIYFYDSSQAPITTSGFNVDAAGDAPNAESKTLTLAAGTYYMAIVWFNYTDPADLFGFRLTGVAP